ncbi:MAG: hypothetical protein AAB706_03165 [Patescibacteria group bacterium]
MEKSDIEETKQFFKYAIYVPFILTLILEGLKVTGIADINWFWVLSPIWIFFGGCLQFMIGGIIIEAFEGGKK